MTQKIMNYFIFKRWRDTDIYIYLRLNALVFFLLIFSFIALLFVKNENLKMINVICSSFIAFLQGIIIFSYKGSTFKTLYYSIMHLFNNDRFDINNKINNNYISPIIAPKIDKSNFNKIDYIKKNISDKQSMVSFIIERDVRNNLLIWSEFLPLNRVNLDYKKQLISHDRMDKKVKCPLSKEEIELKFSLYNEKEILRMFSTYYSFEDYLYCLESSFREPFPVKNNIKELRDTIMDLNEVDYLLEEKYQWINFLDERFKIIKNKRELYDWADIMQNCLKSYDSKLKNKESIVVALTELGNIVYVIEIIPDKGLVKEMKGYKNEEPFKSEELNIKKYIHGTFKKYSKN